MTKHVRIILLFAVLTLVFFAPVLFTNQTHLPIGLDFVNFNYPNDLFASRSFQQGEIPLWNPYVSAGQPYAADPNIGAFYPFRLILTLTSFNYQAMTHLVIFHYFLAGLFAYALARDLGAAQWGGIIAGIGFMFSGFLIGQMDHINIVMSSVWLPLVFLFFRRAILAHKTTYALISGIFLSLSVLGGHQQFSLFIGYWCGLWLIVYLIHQRGQGFIHAISLFALMGLVALAAAAVQIIPTIEFFQFTERSVFTIRHASAYSMPPFSWLLLISPHYLGKTYTEGLPFWETYVNVNEFYTYMGIIVLFGAVIGSYVWTKWEKHFLIAITLIAFFLSVGDVTPLFQLVFNLVPGMKWVRVPTRFVLWINMSLPLLAGFGVDGMMTHLTNIKDKIWRDIYTLLGLGILAGIAIRLIYPLQSLIQISNDHPFSNAISQYRLNDAMMLAILMLGMLIALLLPRYRMELRTWTPILLIGLLVIDLFRAQQPRHMTTEDGLANFQHPEILQMWSNDPGFYRVDSIPKPDDNSDPELKEALYWNPLSGLVHGFPQTFGLPWNPFDLAYFNEYHQAVTYDSSFYDFLGTKYLVTAKGQLLSDKWIRQPTHSLTLDVFENSTTLPRAFMVFSSLVETDPDRSLSMIKQESFDPTTTVLLDKGEPFTGPSGNSHVSIAGFTANTLSLMVSNDQPGYLVISDTYYPGWRVLVNGEEREILRANYAFRAVFLESGESTIRFEFHSSAFAWGLSLTLLTWLVVGLIVFISVRTSKHQ